MQLNLLSGNSNIQVSPAVILNNSKVIQQHKIFERSIDISSINLHQVVCKWRYAMPKLLPRDLERHAVIFDPVTYGAHIKACGIAKAFPEGKLIHAFITQNGYLKNIFLANNLVQMYDKCGALDEGRHVFENMSHRNRFSWNIMLVAYIQRGKLGAAWIVFRQMPEQDVVSWNAMVAAYNQHGQEKYCLKIFQEMQEHGIVPDEVSYISALDACGSQAALARGKHMHTCLMKQVFEYNIAVATTLINMYAKCGSLTDAVAVFDRLQNPNVISWTTMLTKYALVEHNNKSFQLFQHMQREGLTVNSFTYSSVLDACSGVLAEAKLIHSQIISHHLELDLIVSTALINTYGKCGSLSVAFVIFDRMPLQNLASWNALITSYTQHRCEKEAFELFFLMQHRNCAKDNITFIGILNACVNLEAFARGKQVHAHIVHEILEQDVAVGNALINMYGKCGSLKCSQAVFERMLERNLVSWTAMLAAYVVHGHGGRGVQIFEEMNREGMIPDQITLGSVLDACTAQVALSMGKRIHAYIIDKRCEGNGTVGIALVNMYGKCGSLRDSYMIFRMHEESVVLWNVIITAHIHHGHCKGALQLFQEMRVQNLLPSDAIFLSALDACACEMVLAKGKEIHDQFVQLGFRLDVVIGNALVNMYSKCGSLENAWAIFERMKHKDGVSWGSMITAFAQHGHGMEAIQLFEQVQFQGIVPNSIMFVSIITACSHASLVDEGCHYFEIMAKDYIVSQRLDHYNSLNDLLGRVGLLDEAKDLISNMPFAPDAKSWITILSSCRLHVDVQQGEHAAKEAFMLDMSSTAPFVLLYNLYAAAGKWENVMIIRKLMKEAFKDVEIDC